jgi:hypothetical protein
VLGGLHHEYFWAPNEGSLVFADDGARAPRITLRQSRRNAFYERRKWDQNGTKKCFTWDQMPNFDAFFAKNSSEINGRGDRI